MANYLGQAVHVPPAQPMCATGLYASVAVRISDRGRRWLACFNRAEGLGFRSVSSCIIHPCSRDAVNPLAVDPPIGLVIGDLCPAPCLF